MKSINRFIRVNIGDLLTNKYALINVDEIAAVYTYYAGEGRNFASIVMRATGHEFKTKETNDEVMLKISVCLRARNDQQSNNPS